MLITSGSKRVKGRRGTDCDTVNTFWKWNKGLTSHVIHANSSNWKRGIGCTWKI